MVISIKSPGGSLFPYFYKGGEIHCLKYGSFFDDSARLIDIIHKESEFIKSRPSQKLRIWVDFYETNLTDEILLEFVEQLMDLQSQIIKLAIVGCPLLKKYKLNKVIKNKILNKPFLIQYFKDPEVAKEWLVNES